MSEIPTYPNECRHEKPPSQCWRCLSARVDDLESAIGVMTPTICRAYIATTEFEPERQWTWNVLKRLNDVMGRPTEPLESMDRMGRAQPK